MHEGDIIKQQVDAIVKAANNSLLGAGVDRVIHRRFLEGNKKVEDVLAVCYTRDVYDAYRALLQSNESA